jgi:hypothetical protein
MIHGLRRQATAPRDQYVKASNLVDSSARGLLEEPPREGEFPVTADQGSPNFSAAS